MRKSILFFRLSVFSSFFLSTAYGQADTANNIRLHELSLQQLLQVKVVSASKNSELLFDAPLSASVLTRDEIRRAGSTSIMEALRLIPGMVVREQTNGNYDIYIRGIDNVPTNASFEGSSTTVLVMLNNRPIYNYLKGGTFWETLPVDINDVEKIEVVRGPAAALYGPNALSGIINIITNTIEKEGLYSTASLRTASNSTYIANSSLGYRFNKQWSLMASGNFQSRERTQLPSYEIFRGEWLTDPEYLINYSNDTLRNPKDIFPHPGKSIKKYAANLFLNYDPASKIKLAMSAGAQHSWVQRVSTENAIGPLSTVASDSRYADLSAQIKSLSAQLSYNEGTQIPDHQPGNKYDFSTLDMNIEYAFTKNNFSIKPGASYRRAIYDDTKYADAQGGGSIFNERALLTTASGSLRGEYKLAHEKVRLIAGVMASKFNYPDTSYLSYELAATWKTHKNHLLRAVFSSSPRSSTIYDSHVNQRFGFYPIGQQKYMALQVESNRQLQLLSATMLELGYRGIISKRLSIDVEVFSTRSKNPSALMPNDPYATVESSDTILVVPYRATNLPLKLQQYGLSVAMQYSTRKIQAKSSVTIQKSEMKDYSPYMNTPLAPPVPTNPNPAVNNIYSGLGTTTAVESTPQVFASAYLNYLPAIKWAVNLSAYYYSSQEYQHSSAALFVNSPNSVDKINGKLLLNMHVSYQLIKGLELSTGIRNIFNDQSREFFKTDKVPAMFEAGLHWELK